MASAGPKITALRTALRETQELFAERFGVTQTTVSRWEDGMPVVRRLQQPIAELAGQTVAEFFHSDEGPRVVPIVGYVSAGDKFTPIDDEDPAARSEHVTISFNDSAKVAVIVRGDSMVPAYRPGDVIVGMLASRTDLTAAIGKDCIVRTEAGEGYVKRVMRGTKPGTFRLRSYNSAYDDIDDVRLEWAAPVRYIERRN